MKKLLLVCGFLAAGLALATLFAWLSSKVDPVVWEPGPNPGLTGEFAANDRLARARFLLRGAGRGPEDIAVGPDGYLYTAYRDGRIVRFADDGHLEEVADTGGYPLGLRFDAYGYLIVADAERGLLRVSPGGAIELLADSVNGERMLFVDGVDVAADGTIWFTDASRRFGHGDNIYIFLEARATGRLLSYAPDTGAVTVHLDDLFFANGVAVGPDDAYVLVSETGAGRIRRLWLAGDRAGSADLFFDGLPGAPDNLTIDDRGTVWVALPGLRNADAEALADRPWIRRLLGALPARALTPPGRHAFIVGLDADGRVVHNLQAADSPFRTVTSARRRGDRLYIGSLGTDAVGVLDLN